MNPNKITKQLFLEAAQGMAQAVFICLGIGFLFTTVGTLLNLNLLVTLGNAMKFLLTPSIGAAVAWRMKAQPITLVVAMATAAIGGNAFTTVDGKLILSIGEPVGALLTAMISVYIGQFFSGKGRFDMMIIPIIVLLFGGIAGQLLAAIIAPTMIFVSQIIAQSVASNVIVSSIIIGVVWSLLIVSPISSAAMAIAVNLNPIASAAALIGCTIQFSGFVAISWRENDAGRNIAQFICTPKLQLTNIMRNPWTLVPNLLAVIVCAPLAVVVGGLQSVNQVAGLGLCAFVAPLQLFDSGGIVPVFVYAITGIILPMIISFLVAKLMRQQRLIKLGDLTIE